MLSQNKKLRTLVPDQVVRGWGRNLGGLQIHFHVTVARKTGKKKIIGVTRVWIVGVIKTTIQNKERRKRPLVLASSGEALGRGRGAGIRLIK